MSKTHTRLPIIKSLPRGHRGDVYRCRLSSYKRSKDHAKWKEYNIQTFIESASVSRISDSSLKFKPLRQLISVERVQPTYNLYTYKLHRRFNADVGYIIYQ